MDSKLTKVILVYYIAFGMVALVYGFILRYFVIEYYHSTVTTGPAAFAFCILGFGVVNLQLLDKVSKSKDFQKESVNVVNSTSA